MVAVEGIEGHVFDELARELGQDHLAQAMGVLLFEDVSATFRKLIELGILQLAQQQPLMKPAFLFACYYNIPFSDALSATLAELTGYPLLLVDRGAYDRLRRVAVDRPRLELVWLPDRQDL
ncbi:MAG: hypothetical protein HY331_17480 [Chloroflexi bacterium]|nr:hypothetical protein [Chloroflexota bacterium]